MATVSSVPHLYTLVTSLNSHIDLFPFYNIDKKVAHGKRDFGHHCSKQMNSLAM
jgi:hypothetical protein